MSVGRYAPSPTGPQHVGNLRTALAAWLFARSAGSEFLLRFEDLDSANSRAEHESGQADDLARLGLDWDGEPVRQSERLDRYETVLDELSRAGQTYPCWCSRREIREATSAPHQQPGHYPGTCRQLTKRERSTREASGRPPATRLRTNRASIAFVDRLHGEQHGEVDDFVLRRGDGAPAYHLAVVVDDSAQGVQEVVRADDLLSSTARHAYLFDLLDQKRPAWAHVPLVMAPDGDRLAKRHGSVTLHDRMALGDSPERVLAVLARSLGIDTPEREIRATDLVPRFDPAGLSLARWTLTTREMNEPW